MKAERRLTALLICTALLLCFAGCQSEPAPTAPNDSSTPSSADDSTIQAEDLYLQARAPIDDASELLLRIDAKKITSVGGETFTEITDQSVSFSGIGTDAMIISSKEDISYDGSYNVSYNEIFSNGTLYIQESSKNLFSGTVTAGEYCSRIAPAVLLDAALYSTITSTVSDDSTTVTFTDPIAAEAWALPEGAEMINASGTAVISTSGKLEETSYFLTYSYGPAEISLDIQVCSQLKADPITLPENAADYIMLQYVDAVKLMDQAIGYLLQSKTVTANATESIVSQAAGFVRNQSTTLNLYSHDSELLSKGSYNTYVMDSSGQSQSYTQEEFFRDGKYTYSVNGGEPMEEPSITALTLLNYCDEEFLSHMFAYNYWQDATAVDLGSVFLVNCTFSEELGDILCDQACTALFSNPDYLDSYASAYKATGTTGYFALDKFTGLPTAAGFISTGEHTIGGQQYLLSYQSDQSIESPSLSAYKQITDELLPEAAPDNAATPLFYRVTGKNGQQMWMLGTIHVGDTRTNFLPQEIYNAFDGADALAVEFDSNAFNAKLETDTEFQGRISSYYYYADGTTIADHIDPELYEIAVQYMKASGNYNMNIDLMKASIWANSIDNFLLRQSYDLTGDQGMDNRLLTLAEEANKPILNVESGESQIKMMTGYSEKLQEVLLGESVSYSPTEYWVDVKELYEKWCQGDEAILRAELTTDSDELAEMTSEELALYAEYTNAMTLSRNEHMLKVAKEYLESGKTVFFAVGLAHLLEGNGLVDALRDAGYTVEQVIYQ